MGTPEAMTKSEKKMAENVKKSGIPGAMALTFLGVFPHVSKE